MDAYWFEQCERDVPSGDEWLSRDERVRLERLRIPKRRADWRLGRWTAKVALATLRDLGSNDLSALDVIEVRAVESGAPELHLNGEPANVAMSLSHTTGRALVVLSPARASIGCDVEHIETRSETFIQDYFTPEEQGIVFEHSESDRALLANLIWSAKESALKALGVGLRASTHSVRVTIEAQLTTNTDAARWSALRVENECGKLFAGAWSRTGSFVRTVVAAEPVLQLLRLFPTGAGQQLSTSGRLQFQNSSGPCDNSKHLRRFHMSQTLGADGAIL